MKPIPIRISQIEYALPAQVVTNEDLEKANSSWNLKDLSEKTGVKSRRIAKPGESALDFALQASQRVLENHPKAEIQALVFCTQSPDYVMPPNSALLHQRLGLPSSVATFDFNLACSGYVYGLSLCASWMQTLGFKKVLLVTGDTYSKYIHPEDKATRTLFGDGASATLLESAQEGSQIIDLDLGTESTGWNKFFVEAGGLKYPKSSSTCLPIKDIAGNLHSKETIFMDGRAVMEFVKTKIPPSIHAILDRNQLTWDSIDLVLFHQASKTALDTLQKVLKLPMEKTFSNLTYLGNTVSSSIPMAIKDAENAGKLKRGDLLLLVGFGVGFSWGTCLLRW